jgi:hypothetical protein
MQELAGEIEDLTRESQEMLEAELANREDADAVTLDSAFLNALQSVDTQSFSAIEGNYAYDQLYNYDSLVANYVEQQLQIGVT